MKIGIIGCGMAGPACAAFLAGKNVADITLFERASELGPVGAGILLQPTGQGVLQRLGLWEAARALGRPIRRLEALSPTGRTILDLNYRFLPDYSSGGLGIHRGALFHLLHGAAEKAGVEVRKGHEVTELARRGGKKVVLRDRAGSDLGEFDLVVVSSGLRTTLAGDLLPRRKLRPYRWGAWWTSLPDPEEIFGDVLFQVYERTNRLVGFLPTGKRFLSDGVPLASMFWSLKRTGNEASVGMPPEEFAWLKGEILRLVPRAASLLEKLKEPGQLALATYADGRMPSWSAGNVVVVGDAAHPMSPHLGQGTNLALMDAEVLAEAVSNFPDRLELALTRYEKERRSHVEFYQWISRLMMPFFQSDARVLGELRDFFVPKLCGMPWARRQMLEVLAGIKRFPWARLEKVRQP